MQAEIVFNLSGILPEIVISDYSGFYSGLKRYIIIIPINLGRGSVFHFLSSDHNAVRKYAIV
jgi:hypothetical protein